MIIQIVAAFLGTIAFALLFSVPKEDYIPAGVIGALGWLIYCILTGYTVSPEIASFVATVIVVLGARFFAVIFQTPSTMFLIPGIFPLVPGGKVYWTAHYFVLGNSQLASENGIGAIRCAFCIVLGIMLVLQMPGRIFKAALIFRRERN